jgi:putative transposase
MHTLIVALITCVRAALMSRAALALENAALRQQLAVYLRISKRTRLRTNDRVFWVILRRLWPDWNRPLVIVRPATVIAWHRKGFKLFWRRKSRRGHIGRPRIPRKHIAFIQRISGDHPEWGEDKIAEELAAKFGIQHSPSTIRRYMIPRPSAPRGDQTWRTFIHNHAREVWACDFLTQYTAFFAVAYVFIIMEIGSRRIVHVNVTTNPTLSWVKQQIREAMAEGRTTS